MWITIFFICLVANILCTWHMHSRRSIDGYAFVGMVIIAVIPLVNIFVAALLLIRSVSVTYSDVIAALKKDSTTC
jgi:hypothetical protein